MSFQELGRTRTGSRRPVCRFFLSGTCRFGSYCRNSHRVPVLPDLRPAPAPTPAQEEHQKERSTQKDSQCSKPPATEIFEPTPDPASASRTCGICFDTIMEKPIQKEQLFAIFPNCIHCFCFPCIRKWRQSKEFDSDISRSCPECRQVSDFVYRSRVWYNKPEMKKSFIERSNERMQMMDCRYFNKGLGSCPFGNTCLYLHALDSGEKIDLGPPAARARPRITNPSDREMIEEILYLFDEYDDEDDEADPGTYFIEANLDDADLSALNDALTSQLIALHFYNDQIRLIEERSELAILPVQGWDSGSNIFFF